MPKLPAIAPLLALVLLPLLLIGCASNPWANYYQPVGPGPQPPLAEDAFVSVELVDFDLIDRNVTEPGFEPIGFASFTADYDLAARGQARSFAAEIGATRVLWGLAFLHSAVDTDLFPVTDTSTTRITRDTPDGVVTRERRSYHTTYVPTVNEDAFYAFKGVFLAPIDSRANTIPATPTAP